MGNGAWAEHAALQIGTGEVFFHMKRLQLGASRLEGLPDQVLKVFLDKSWVHLGDDPTPVPNSMGGRLRAVLAKPGKFKAVLAKARPGRLGNAIRTAVTGQNPKSPEQMYQLTNFQGFYYQKGGRLPFPGGTFDFVFSEHFFEHLFLDEAIALMQECHRVLNPGGVLRTLVPDADLRTYEPPERAGFPDPKMPFTHLLKHKTRWSVYSLSEALKMSLFLPIALTYCSREGCFVQQHPRGLAAEYRRCADPETVFDTSYIIRPQSLIVDGLKT